MITSLPMHLLLLTFASYVAAAVSLTPPPVSAPGGSSSSATPTSSGSTGASASANSSRSGTMSSTATSSAQFPSLSGLSSCATQCFGLAIAQDNCTSYVDVNCYCANATRFTSELVGCVSTSCPGDLSSAEDIVEQFCAIASASTSLSFPTPPPSTSFSNPFTSSLSFSSSASRNSSGSSTAPSTTATGTGSSAGNGAGSLRYWYGSREAVMAGAVGLAGALLGVLFA